MVKVATYKPGKLIKPTPPSKKSKRTIHQILGVKESVPIKVAEAPLHIQPKKKDVSGAKRADPTACGYARAACRMYDTPHAAFFRKAAYIEQLDRKGKPYLAKYKLPVEAVKAVKHFDETGEMPEHGIVIVPWPEYLTAEHRRKAAGTGRKLGPRKNKINPNQAALWRDYAPRY